MSDTAFLTLRSDSRKLLKYLITGDVPLGAQPVVIGLQPPTGPRVIYNAEWLGDESVEVLAADGVTVVGYQRVAAIFVGPGSTIGPLPAGRYAVTYGIGGAPGEEAPVEDVDVLYVTAGDPGILPPGDLVYYLTAAETQALIAEALAGIGTGGPSTVGLDADGHPVFNPAGVTTPGQVVLVDGAPVLVIGG